MSVGQSRGSVFSRTAGYYFRVDYSGVPRPNILAHPVDLA